MMEQISAYLMQYGILGIWTITLLWERRDQKKVQMTERKEHVDVIKNVSVNMALVNDNLKQLVADVRDCPSRG